MSRAVPSLILRGSLLRNAYRLSNQTERHQLNSIFKRSIYSKTVAKPAPYLTREVVMNKLLELSPGWFALTVFFLACKFYLTMNGLDFNEIQNYRTSYLPKPKLPE